MNYTLSKPRGLTLIEMLLYVSVCSVILLSLSSLLSLLLSSRVKNQSISNVNQQGIQIMQMVTQTIRNARSIDSPPLGGSDVLISITTGDPLKNPTVFSASGSALYIQEGSSAPTPLTNSRVLVSSTTFQNISSTSSSDRIIRFSFIINTVNQNNRQEYTYGKNFSGSATLRQ
jgi:Tfp pilus assembly protein PilV